MREILGYVPIEPDGSVRVAVPANVAFQISVVDANARRIFPLHRAWLQLLPGEVLQCNGCHLPPAQQNPVAGGSFFSHGRTGLFASAWTGTTSTGPFPGTQGSYTTCLNADGSGETMAEALAGWNCGNSANSATAAALPSVNVVFNDPWFGGGAGNEPVLLSYDDPTFTTPLPTAQNCALPNGGRQRRLDRELPRGHQLPDPYPAAVGQGSRRQHLRRLPHRLHGRDRLSESCRRRGGKQCQPGQLLSAAAESLQCHQPPIRPPE